MDDFLKLCRAFGQLDELVQAGGGNISVKLDGCHCIIKSSGVSLADVTRTKGYSIVNHASIARALEQDTEPSLAAHTVSGGNPSLEVYFHSFMKKYVVHIHPTTMLPYLCSRNATGVPYAKPGFLLSKKIRSVWKGETTVYLNNHGVIFTSDSIPDLLKEANRVYETFRREDYIALDDFWRLQHEFPDEYVYKVCPAETRAYIPILKRNNIRKLTPDIALFLTTSVYVEDSFLFIHAPSKQKCMDILEVLRSYCECVEGCDVALTEMQAADILHWPAEKQRLAIVRET